MIVRFVEEAQQEFLAAISAYEEASPGLGRRLKEEVDRGVHRVADQPGLYRLRPGSYRRINLRTFPYYLAYVVRQQTLWVLAVAHANRQPEYWISRRGQAG